LAISGLPLGSPGTKSHLDVGLVERHRVYYKGEGGGFPQVWAVVSLGSPGTKSHLDVGLVERHRVYYKGEGGGFPQVWAVVSLVSSSLRVVRLSTKSVSTMH